MDDFDETVHSVINDDSDHEYVPGANCVVCGQFVGRDGLIVNAGKPDVSGVCSRCLPEHLDALSEWEARWYG